ncbi:MAG: DUF177 domain-containing protein [Mariprofundaceae bacterium]
MQGKWLVTLQGLPAAGRSWDCDVPQKLLQDPEEGIVDALQGLTGDMHWQLSLEHVGEVFRLQGQWQGSMMRQCSRCNAAFDWQMQGATDRDYQLGQAPHNDETDSECEFILPPGSIHLLDVLREDVWLAWQADVVCSASCKGLCSYCGCNRNTEACQCEQKNSDHPFAALAALKRDA